MPSHPVEVIGKPQRFLRSWIAAAITAIAAWAWLPGSAIDQRAFTYLAKHHYGFAAVVSGEGTPRSPWGLPSAAVSGGIPAPVIVTLGDDADGTFQSSPHAPIDIAVIFSNMQRLGARKAACAALLAWENPDPIGLTALESAISGFDSIVLAAPVTRSAMMEPLPPAFRRASLPIEDVDGSTATLPVVNRVSLPTMIYGGDNSLAGFQVIDSEPADGHLPLVARWDYRVIFSFPVVAAMQQLDLTPNDLIIHIGRHIQLGHQGPRIPIDEFGRLDIKPNPPKQAFSVQARYLIDGEREIFKGRSFESPILCDHRSHGELTTLEFNRTAPAVVHSLISGEGAEYTEYFPRLGSSREMFLLLALALGLAALGTLGNLSRLAVQMLLVGACIAAQSLALKHSQLWIPGIPAIAAIAVATVVSWSAHRRKTTSMPRLERIKFDRTEPH